MGMAIGDFAANVKYTIAHFSTQNRPAPCSGKGGFAVVKQTGDKPPRVGDGTPGPGRPKGGHNKTTMAAKEMISQAAIALGGLDRMVAWAREDEKNEAAFWTTIHPKLLPLQVQGDLQIGMSEETAKWLGKV